MRRAVPLSHVEFSAPGMRDCDWSRDWDYEEDYTEDRTRGYEWWQTADGRVMRIVDMDTKHLFNSMKMLFNHLAQLWGGRPVWFERKYGEAFDLARNEPESIARTILYMDGILAMRTDLPERYSEPLSEMRKQMVAKGACQVLPAPVALPMPAEEQE